MSRGKSGNQLKWAVLAGLTLVAAAGILQDGEIIEESIRLAMSWILMPGIVVVGLAMPSAPFLVMLLVDWVLYSGMFFLAIWSVSKIYNQFTGSTRS